MHIKCQHWRQQGDDVDSKNHVFFFVQIKNSYRVRLWAACARWLYSIFKRFEWWFRYQNCGHCLCIFSWTVWQLIQLKSLNGMPDSKLILIRWNQRNAHYKLNEEALPYKEIIFVGFHFKMLVLLNCFYFKLKYGNVFLVEV